MLTPATHTAAEVIALLDLAPLPHEGGWFRRTHAAAGSSSPNDEYRRAWSTILALFTPEGFSAWHRLTVDELWIHQAGDPLEIARLRDDGAGESVVLGLDPLAGQQPQIVIPAGVWQGARPRPGASWSLVTCVVVPEFRWEDFQLGRRDELLRLHPAQADLVARLTRN